MDDRQAIAKSTYANLLFSAQVWTKWLHSYTFSYKVGVFLRMKKLSFNAGVTGSQQRHIWKTKTYLPQRSCRFLLPSYQLANKIEMSG